MKIQNVDGEENISLGVKQIHQLNVNTGVKLFLSLFWGGGKNLKTLEFIWPCSYSCSCHPLEKYFEIRKYHQEKVISNGWGTPPLGEPRRWGPNFGWEQEQNTLLHYSFTVNTKD